MPIAPEKNLSHHRNPKRIALDCTGEVVSGQWSVVSKEKEMNGATIFVSN